VATDDDGLDRVGVDRTHAVDFGDLRIASFKTCDNLGEYFTDSRRTKTASEYREKNQPSQADRRKIEQPLPCNPSRTTASGPAGVAGSII
jgi:hypothetical protein